MTRARFIEPDERLIAFAENDEDMICPHPLDTVEDAAHYIFKEVASTLKIVRYHIETGTSQDISEQVAEAYIKLYGDELDEDSNVDPFIEVSDAWGDHLAFLAYQAIKPASFAPL